MDYLGGGIVHGQQIKGADQRAAEARDRCQANHVAMATGGKYTPCSEEDYRAIRTVDKRKERGGSTFLPTDAF